MISESDPSFDSTFGVPAVFFDGRHSTRHPVMVTIRDSTVAVSGPGVARTAPLADVEVTERLGLAPRLIRFADGAFCEVADAAALSRLLLAQNVGPARVTQWEGSLRWIGGSAALFVIVLVVAYRYAVPALAVIAADNVPAPIVNLISEEVMTVLDSQVLEPTAVADDRQARLIERFGRLRFPDEEDLEYDIVFRRSELLGPNAMALPSGTMVVTDALVGLAQDDDEIVAVLAHEAGHVAGRHGLRQLFQNSTVALAITWFIGDISMLAAAAPTALLQAKYSRDLEREADTYAIDVLRENDVPLEHFARILERLETAVSGEERSVAAGAMDYLSSHPVTSERLERVRR